MIFEFQVKLINYWPMSNLSDVVGGANLFGGSSYSFVADRFNNPNSAIYLNRGYLQVPPGVYFNGDFTVIVWFQMKSIQTWSRIFEFGIGALMETICLAFNADTTQLIGLTFSGSSYSSIQATSIQLNQWYHVAFVLNGTTGYIYLNGVQSVSGTLIKPNSVSRSTNFIGKSNNGDSNVDGIFDDFRIYQGAMSAAAILTDYTNGNN